MASTTTNKSPRRNQNGSHRRSVARLVVGRILHRRTLFLLFAILAASLQFWLLPFMVENLQYISTALPIQMMSSSSSSSSSSSFSSDSYMSSTLVVDEVVVAVASRLPEDEQARIPTSSSKTMYRKYHEIPKQEFEYLKHEGGDILYQTSFQDAHVIENAHHPWFVPTKQCKETCCVETVAISLDQDDHHIVNSLDGIDLADVYQQRYNPYFEEHLGYGPRFFGAQLQDEIIPCLQPGTIIHIDNYGFLLRHFFQHHRPNMTVPYLLITSESDNDTPLEWGRMLKDDNQLIAWLGLSPNIEHIPEDKREVGKDKLIGFPIGLSKYHDQDRYLRRYLDLTNYSNPFSNKERWTKSLFMTADIANNPSMVDEIFYQTAYVRFGVTRKKRKRQYFHDKLCDGRPNVKHWMDNLTCAMGGSREPYDNYAASSRYLFGFSPEGVGWDCYRTYELLLVGVIPIVSKRKMGIQSMFDDLPVLQLEDFEKYRSREEYLQIFREYITSPEFQNADFEVGWKKLFLRYWRRKVLDLTGRTKSILVDPSTGKEYYQAWRYTNRSIGSEVR